MRRDSFFPMPSPRLLALALAGSALACGPLVAAAGTAGAEGAKAAKAAKAESAAASPAQPGGKPTSGVVVTYSAPAKVAVGETVTLRLQISGVSAADGASVEVRDAAGRTTLLSTRVAAGEQKTLELPYTGRADGMQFIDVVTAQGGRSSVQSLPIRVGSGELKLKPHGQRSATAGGEAVISLPAVTSGASR
jgi:hypothetical protein